MNEHETTSPEPEAARGSVPEAGPLAPPNVPPAENQLSLEAQYKNLAASFRRTHYRPLLGPTLVTTGVLLWAYVVFGSLVLLHRFPEGLAFVILFATFTATAYAGGRQSLALAPAEPGREKSRLVLPGLGALGLTLLTVLLVSAFAHAGRSTSDAPITLFLLAVSFGAATYGYHLSGPNLNPPRPALKAFLVGARVLGALLSIAVIATELVRWR